MQQKVDPFSFTAFRLFRVRKSCVRKQSRPTYFEGHSRKPSALGDGHVVLATSAGSRLQRSPISKLRTTCGKIASMAGRVTLVMMLSLVCFMLGWRRAGLGVGDQYFSIFLLPSPARKYVQCGAWPWQWYGVGAERLGMPFRGQDDDSGKGWGTGSSSY